MNYGYKTLQKHEKLKKHPFSSPKYSYNTICGVENVFLQVEINSGFPGLSESIVGSTYVLRSYH